MYFSIQNTDLDSVENIPYLVVIPFLNKNTLYLSLYRRFLKTSLLCIYLVQPQMELV